MPGRELQKIEKLFARLQSAARIEFPKQGKTLDATERQGVYVIFSPAGKVLHVGRTSRAKKGIAQRLRNHMANQSSFTTKYLNGKGVRLRNGYKYSCLPVSGTRQRALLEAFAIGQLCPAHIGKGKTALTEQQSKNGK